MAIKIKNRDRDSEEPEEEGTGGVAAPAAGNLDRFERTSLRIAAWVEDNRGMVLGLVIAIVVAVIAGVVGMQYVQGQQVQASDRLSPAMVSYEVLVEGSPILEMWRSQEDVPAPTTTFDSDEERWRAIYDAAEGTLREFDRGPIVVSATLTKAAASLALGRAEEAVALYRQVVASPEASDDLKTFAHVGLAESLAATGDVDGAVEALERFAAARPDQQSFADFQAARIVERSGDTDAARERYESFLEAHGESGFRNEVERRLALM